MRKVVKKSKFQAIGIVLAGIFAAALLTLYMFTSSSHGNTNLTLPFLLGFGTVLASCAIAAMFIKPWFRHRAYKRGKISHEKYYMECMKELTDDSDMESVFENTPMESVTSSGMFTPSLESCLKCELIFFSRLN